MSPEERSIGHKGERWDLGQDSIQSLIAFSCFPQEAFIDFVCCLGKRRLRHSSACLAMLFNYKQQGKKDKKPIIFRLTECNFDNTLYL